MISAEHHGRRRPVPVLVELTPDLAEALDVWIAIRPGDRLMRCDALADLLRDRLADLGLIPFEEGAPAAS